MNASLNGSLLKGFDILRMISRERPEITAAMVAAEMQMNFGTAHRFLTTLEEAGALVAVRRGVFGLGLAVVELGRLAELTNPVAPMVQPLIERLCGALNESVMVCRLGRSGPVCVAVALTDRPITVSIRVGTALSALNSAQGRLWLADMDKAARDAVLQGSGVDRGQLDRDLAVIRAQGFAQNAGLAEPDIAAIAAPIRNGRGELVHTVSVFGPLSRFVPAFVDLAREKVVAVARQIEAQMRP